MMAVIPLGMPLTEKNYLFSANGPMGKLGGHGNLRNNASCYQ
jgi:hypothetical protein